jgi:hypothetical protein
VFSRSSLLDASATIMTESLRDRVNRKKARWLARVMYNSTATSTQKCMAWSVADHLNCVTLDAWPGLLGLSRRLGFMHQRTLERAVQGLEERNFLICRQVEGLWRFAPVFGPGDEDKIVAAAGQSCHESADKNVTESFLRNPPNQSSSSGLSEESKEVSIWRPQIRRGQRGAIEMQVAEWLGEDGFEVLSRLALIGDDVIDRLCKASVDGILTDRERDAARLAAAQVRP